MRIALRSTPCADDVDAASVAERCGPRGYSGADMAAVCREAALAAMEEAVVAAEAAAGGGGDAALASAHEIKVNARHFSKAISVVPPSISQQQITFYEEYARGEA